MRDRRLSAEELALWARVAATVTPLEGRGGGVSPDRHPGEDPDRHRPERALAARDPGLRRDDGKAVRSAAPASTAPTDTLDGGWDRRLRRGLVAPDRTIDLHGHTLASAHAALDAALAGAVTGDARILLVVTGRPPSEARGRRGLIRASIGDWLAGSAYRDRIAAIRHAHPRHGGAGALYLILRRKRAP